MVHGHDLSFRRAVGRRRLLLTDEREGKASIRASHERDPPVGGPTGIIARREARVGESRQT
eukprot:10542205-Alexandrium_andersonii.AAC.1